MFNNVKPAPWGYRAIKVIEWVKIHPHFKKGIHECVHAVTEYPIYKEISGQPRRMCTQCGLFDPPDNGVD